MLAIRYPLHTDISSSTDVSTDTDTFGDDHLNLKDINGIIRSIYVTRPSTGTPLNHFNASTAAGGTYSNSISNTVIWCGSGSTKPTYDDYKLENPFVNSSDISPSVLSISTPTYNADSNCWTYQIKRTFQAHDDINVGEIGMLFPHNYRTGYSSSYLIYRDVIETPKPVAKDSFFTVTITLSYSANPNDPVRVSTSIE